MSSRRRRWRILFLGIGTADTNATLQLAAILLVVGATFFIADGVQTVAAGALRGLNDTPVCFWAIGFVACYAFGFTLGYGATGIWVGLSIGLALYALLLIWRFHSLTKHGYLPDIITAA